MKELYFFTGKDCAPCKMAKPHVKKLCEEIGLSVREIDRDFDKGISFHFKILSVPTFILYAGGKEVKRMEGFGSVAKLKEFLEVK